MKILNLKRYRQLGNVKKKNDGGYDPEVEFAKGTKLTAFFR